MTIATTENVASGVAVEHGKVLSYLGLNPSDPKSQAVVAVAQRYDLDPLLKHVIVIPKGGVYVTRDGLLHVAHRSGQLDGIVVDQEPTLSEDGAEWIARVSVYRKDMGHPFTFPGRYPVKGMNRDYAQEMALKAAESHALRRAFDITGLPALDEQRPEETPAAGGLASVVATQNPSPAPDAPRPSASAEPDPASESEQASAGEVMLNTSSTLAKRMFALMNEQGITQRPDRLLYASDVIGREIGSSAEMTEDDARSVIVALEADAKASADAGGDQ